MMLGIYEPCPNNVRFLIKTLKKVGFQKKFYVKVRLILKMHGHQLVSAQNRESKCQMPLGQDMLASLTVADKNK